MSRRSVAILLALLCCIPLVYLAIAAHDPRSGWDDGAITLAYARTLSHAHRFSLTPISPVAEGSSSLLWTALLALPFHWTLTPTAMLITGELAAALALLLLLLATFRLATRFLPPGLALLPVTLLALSKAPFSETINGMEMNLYALLAVTLALVLLRETNAKRLVFLGWLLASSILLVRFESPLLLLALFAGIAWQYPHQRRRIATLAALTALTFLVIEAARHHVFHAWVPNTVLAKRWYAYTGASLRARLQYRLDALDELFMVLAVPLAAVLLATATSRHPVATARRPFANGRMFFPLGAAAALQCAILGRNWGQEGRMLVGFLPFLLIAFCVLLRRTMQDNRLPLTVVAVLAIAAQGWLLSQAPKTMLNGFDYRWCEMAGVDANALRVALQLKQAVFLTPDVGGVGLCCEQINVLDLGLLTNPTLARTGFAGLPALFHEQSPDIVEAKAPWSIFSGLYSTHLLEGYSPVEVRDALFYVRNDLVRANGRLQAASCASLPQPAWWSAMPEDMAIVRQQSQCYVLRAEP